MTTDELRRAINAKEPTRFAVMDPAAVAARREWFRNGMQGHYPGCPCGKPHFTPEEPT